MFVSPAFAQAAQGTIAGLDPNILMLPLLLVVFYFLLIRPQQKRAKKHRELLSSLRRGDRVLTSGGIYGVVTKVVNDTELAIEIADGVRVRVARNMVHEVVSKTEPVAADKAEAAEAPEEM